MGCERSIKCVSFIVLKDIVHTWYLTLTATDKGDLGRLNDAFCKRFVLRPHSWILSQQLAQGKQKPNESLDTYVTDITRLCRRLEMGDKDAMRFFIDGLHDDELLLQQTETYRKSSIKPPGRLIFSKQF